MNILIKEIENKDYRRVEEVIREAFWNLYRLGCEEHWLAHRMWEHPDYIPSLSFCLEVEGIIVGAILYSKSEIIHSDGKSTKTITFGPVAILPSLHRQGLGRLLIEHSIAKAQDEGYQGIIMLGYRHHYEPYGFMGAKKYGITMPDGQYYQGLLALPLQDGALHGKPGYVQFSQVFEALSPEDVDRFDQNFPFKKKCFMPSQREFERASMALDE